MRKPQNVTKQVQLPPIESRQVIGTWLISEPGFSMTRSIERVGQNFYLVMRMLDEEGNRIGGNSGLPLKRIDSRKFKGVAPNPTEYIIGKQGDLQCSSPAAQGVFFVGKAQFELWPN